MASSRILYRQKVVRRWWPAAVVWLNDGVIWKVLGRREVRSRGNGSTMKEA